MTAKTADPQHRLPERQPQHGLPFPKLGYQDGAFVLTQQHGGQRVWLLLRPVRAATLVYITTAFSKLSQLSSRKASMRQPLFSVR